MGLFKNHASGSSEPPPPSYGSSSEQKHVSSPVPEKSQYAAPSYQPPSFGCLQLGRTDRIRTICLPDNVRGPIEEAIRRVWAPGIQKADWYEPNSWEWKLSGNPWYGMGAEAVASRRLLAHVVHALASVGWHLHVATDLSKKSHDKDTLIFQHGQPRQRYIFTVTFNMSDRIRIIDAPSPEIVQAFQLAVQSSWALGIQHSKEKEPGCWEMKLKGIPWWTSDGSQVNMARLVICQLLTTLDTHGFELLASVDMSYGSGGNDGVSDTDSWFFAIRMCSADGLGSESCRWRLQQAVTYEVKVKADVTLNERPVERSSTISRKKEPDGPGPSKKRKSEAVAETSTDIEIQENEEGDQYFELSGKKRLTVRKFKDMLLIDIREYYLDKKTDTHKPGNKGISLTEDQLKVLLGNSDNIRDMIVKRHEKS